MRPLTETVPKPMLPVADRPLCAHTADAAVEVGASELVFVVGYEAESVRSYFGDSYRDVPISYATQEEQRGTAHAVACASRHLDGDFVVLNGDNIYDKVTIARLFERAPAVVAVRVSSPSNYGVLSAQGERVTDIVEKPDDPPSNLVNAGGYAFPEFARDQLDVGRSNRGEHEITDVLQRVIDETTVVAVEADRWLDVGRPWELLEANEWQLETLERTLEGDISPDADVRGPVHVEPGARVESGAVIEGPALIRRDATVGPDAYVRSATLLCEGAHVGHGAEVKNSVVMSEAAVPHLSYVGDSILGPKVNLGAGTQVANLRHDDADVQMTVKGTRVSTERRKFGVVAGPGAKTGVNTSIDPGVVLSAGATTHPGEYVATDR